MALKPICVSSRKGLYSTFLVYIWFYVFIDRHFWSEDSKSGILPLAESSLSVRQNLLGS